MYQVCTCPQSNLTGGDPNCPIHGKQPESVTTSWCTSCEELKAALSEKEGALCRAHELSKEICEAAIVTVKEDGSVGFVCPTVFEEPVREAYKFYYDQSGPCRHEVIEKRLRRSLEAGGFTDEGGELWKPPVNKEFPKVWEEKERLREAIEWACKEMVDGTKAAMADERVYFDWVIDELRRRAGKEGG